jgi:hypothetical protein
MAKTIFDIVTSGNIASYWTELGNNATNFTEELFPTSKQLGIDLKWIKGSRGQPIALKASAFDAHSIPRPRIGVNMMMQQMPYFKESYYIDEELRQQLNMVLSSGNQTVIDSIMTRVFDDAVRLLAGAAARREQMRSMVLSTGSLAFVSNGQEFLYDYGVSHKANAAKSWADPTSDPLEDIRFAKEMIQSDTGDVLTRAMCDGLSWKNLRYNEKIRKSVFMTATSTDGYLSDQRLKQFIRDEMGLEVHVNDNQFMGDSGTSERYMPENTFTMFPDGELGRTWYGTTPAESDLMNTKAANVSIVDTGVAITVVVKADPVQTETIVSQICMPSLEKADSIYILDTKG